LALAWAWALAGALALAGAVVKLEEYKYTKFQIFWILLLTASLGLAVGWVLYQIYPWYELWNLGD